MNEIIKTENLTHVYMPDTPFEKTPIHDISMSVFKGEFLGIVGHTGSGKSTLIQHFNGLLKPHSGRVLINGQDIYENKKIRDLRFSVGLVFQYAEYQLFEETVFKDIAFGPKNKGLSQKEIEEAVLWASEQVGLDSDLLQKSPFELSGGQKRRVAIAGVLAMKPEVLVLDEPAAGLDPKAKKKILDMLKSLNKSGLTVVIVSHSMEDIADYADRMIILNHGRVAEEGVPRDIFQKKQMIEAMGLSVPEASEILFLLSDRGYDIDTSACTIGEATKAIANLLRGGEK